MGPREWRRRRRREATRLLEGHGARVTGSVSGRTDSLVVGEGPGSKLDDARALEVKTLDERALVRMLRRRGVQT